MAAGERAPAWRLPPGWSWSRSMRKGAPHPAEGLALAGAAVAAKCAIRRGGGDPGRARGRWPGIDAAPGWCRSARAARSSARFASSRRLRPTELEGVTTRRRAPACSPRGLRRLRSAQASLLARAVACAAAEAAKRLLAAVSHDLRARRWRRSLPRPRRCKRSASAFRRPSEQERMLRALPVRQGISSGVTENTRCSSCASRPGRWRAAGVAIA